MLNKTVNFDDMNSWEYFGIVFENLDIGSPEPQLILIDVPFKNGSLDETDYFGDVFYKDRDIKMDFIIPWWTEKQHDVYSKVLNRLNGQRCKIRFSADKEWYYEGRLKVSNLSHDGSFWKFSIDVTADPYKYKDTEISFSVGSSQTFKLYNECMKTVPVVETDKIITITCHNKVFSFPEGTYKHGEFVLEEGDNMVLIEPSGPASVTFYYKQGRL